MHVFILNWMSSLALVNQSHPATYKVNCSQFVLLNHSFSWFFLLIVLKKSSSTELPVEEAARRFFSPRHLQSAIPPGTSPGARKAFGSCSESAASGAPPANVPGPRGAPANRRPAPEGASGCQGANDAWSAQQESGCGDGIWMGVV